MSQRMQQHKVEKVVENLQHVALFKGLGDDRLREVAPLCELIALDGDDFLTREDTEAAALYILLSGEVVISKRLSLPRVGQLDTEDRTLTRISSNNMPVLAETALVGHTHRHATIRCAGACLFYRLDSGKLSALCEDHKEIGVVVYHQLCQMLYQRLQSANNDIVKLTTALVFALNE